MSGLQPSAPGSSELANWTRLLPASRVLGTVSMEAEDTSGGFSEALPTPESCLARALGPPFFYSKDVVGGDVSGPLDPLVHLNISDREISMVKINRGFGKHIKQYQKKGGGQSLFAFQEGSIPRQVSPPGKAGADVTSSSAEMTQPSAGTTTLQFAGLHLEQGGPRPSNSRVGVASHGGGAGEASARSLIPRSAGWGARTGG